MKSLKILLVSQWYPPEPCKQPSDIARSLQEAGHTVQVLTGFPNYPAGRLYGGYQMKLCRREVVDGIDTIRVPLFPDHSLSRLKRALNYLSFTMSSAVGGPLTAAKPDVVLVVHPPVTLGVTGWVLSRIWRVPFVFYMMDMWPETLKASGMVTSPFLLGLVGALARWTYKNADRVIVVTDGFRRNLLAKGVPDQKLDVVYQMVDTDLYRPRERDERLALDLGLAGRFNVMYAGAIGMAQGLDTFIEAAAIARSTDTRVQFVLVGDGVALPRLKARAATLGLQNVSFLGSFPVERMSSLYALADVLFLHLRDDPALSITVPHKVFAYMASGKPLLAAIAGDAAEIVQQTGAGAVCRPGDATSVAAAIARLRLLSAEALDAMGRRGRTAACEQFSRHRQSAQLCDVLASCLGRQVGGSGHTKPRIAG